jgi:peroxiredoxin
MKIKNIIILVSVLLLLGASAFFLFNKIQQKRQKKAVYSSIPYFRIPDINGQIVTDGFLREHKTIMFLYFNPDCDLCRDEIIQIKENESVFALGEIVFFSESPADSIQRFLQTINFNPTQNMSFLSDEKATLVNKMEPQITPTVYIYRQGQLAKRFDGPVKIETLIRYFTEE